MKSLQHVLWRGTLALSLMAVGIGGGLGMPPAETTASAETCIEAAAALVATSTPTEATAGRTVELTPAG